MIYHYSVVNNENPEDVIHTSIGRIGYPTWVAARAMGNAMLKVGGNCHPNTHHFIISEHEEEIQVKESEEENYNSKEEDQGSCRKGYKAVSL